MRILSHKKYETNGKDESGHKVCEANTKKGEEEKARNRQRRKFSREKRTNRTIHNIETPMEYQQSHKLSSVTISVS